MTHPLSKALRELGEKLDGEGVITLDEKADMIEVADALDARATTESEWQDISTAPKDGTSILIYMRDSNCPIVVGHWEDGKRWGADESWWAFDEMALSDIFGSIEDPTHWMPLPRKPGEPK